MGKQDLRELGITKFGDRKFLYEHLQKLVAVVRVVDESKDTNNTSVETEMTKENPDDGVPSQFLDPITFEMMNDPVICSVSGQTYERKTIEDYIEQNGMDPIT